MALGCTIRSVALQNIIYHGNLYVCKKIRIRFLAEPVLLRFEQYQVDDRSKLVQGTTNSKACGIDHRNHSDSSVS